MTKYAKIILLFALTILGAIIFELSIKLIFSGSISLIWSIIIAAIAFGMAVGFWALSQYLLSVKLSHLLSVIFVFVIFIFSPQNIYFYVFLIILLAACFIGQNSIHREKDARVKIMLDEVTASGAKIVLAALCLIFTLYFSYSAASKPTELTLSPNLQEQVLSYAIPGYTKDTSIDQMVWLLMIRGEKSNDSQDRQQLLNEKMLTTSPEHFNTFKNAILEKAGISATLYGGASKVSETDVLNSLVEQNVNQYLVKYQNFIHFILVILFYLIIFFSWKILYPIIYLFIWSVYKILLMSRFIKISKGNISCEKVEM